MGYAREAFWNGLFDVRWEEAPLGPEAIRLIRRLRERGYAERTCRDYGHAVVHLGRYLHEELESDRVRDEGVVADFLAGHLPECRCYRRPAGRRAEPARLGPQACQATVGARVLTTGTETCPRHQPLSL